MTALSSLAAVLIGGSLPLVVLVVFTRWRNRQVAGRLAARALRRSEERMRRRERPRLSLTWLHATIGRRPNLREDATPVATGRRCPHCRYLNTEPSVYCRRCGTRLFGG
jgi:uncharacterized paraquat-inducible protein A